MNKYQIEELSVFFPCYNEEKNIKNTVSKAVKVLKKVAKKWEIILINDGSKDNTAKVIEQIKKEYPKEISIITHNPNRGYGAALKSGLYNAKYDDNISSSTKIFSNGELIEFFVKVTNSGDTNLKNIKVTDNLPPFLKLIFYPGTYNSTDNKLEWTIDELNAGHSQEFLIRAKIDKASEVKTLTKETNVAQVRVDELGARDDASYYILNKGTTIVPDGKGEIIIPETGNGALIIETIGVISVGLSGLALRKKIRGY